MSTATASLQMLLQGLYSLIWIAILLDVGSPPFDLRDLPEWSAGQVAIVVVVLLAVGYATGIAMHTLSRNVFRRHKDGWALRVLSASMVRDRFVGLGVELYLQVAGAPTLTDVDGTVGPEKRRNAGEIMHSLDYAVMTRVPHVYQSIQLYRHQYRLARGFIIPSVLLGVVLPLWDPVVEMGGARFGPMTLVGAQLLMLSLLFASVAYLAFRDRAFRYITAQIRAFVISEAERRFAGAEQPT